MFHGPLKTFITILLTPPKKEKIYVAVKNNKYLSN